MIKIVIDPPEGWRYGSPKYVTEEEWAHIKDLKKWCIANGYPESEANKYGDYLPVWEYEL